MRSKLSLRLEEKLKHFTVPRLLFIDEIRHLPIDRTGANLFVQLISRCYERGPIILDRILNHAITLNIRGNSYPLKEKLRAGLIRGEEPDTAIQ